MEHDDPHKQEMFIESLKALIRANSFPDLAVSAMLALRISASLSELLYQFAVGTTEATVVEHAIQEAASLLPSSHLLADPAEIAKLMIEFTPHAYRIACSN